MKKGSFIFFGELIQNNIENRIVLFENYVLKKANEEQIEYIQDFIADYTKILHNKVNRYEYYASPKDNGLIYNHLERNDWNYWIIEHTEINMSDSVPLALGLSKMDLTILFEAAYIGIKTAEGKEVAGTLSNQLTTLTFFYNTRFEKLEKKMLTELDVKEINGLFHSIGKFKETEEDFEFIKKALQDFLKLQEIPKDSPFRILGYFSILELLLTNYKPNENSINNQLQAKINLVNNQIENSINFSDYFQGADTNSLELIVGKLYHYRNDIAHGNKSDFEKQLFILKNNKIFIEEFLRALTKRVLIFAVEESKLIADLKMC